MMQSDFAEDLMYGEYDSMPPTSSPTGTNRTLASMPTSRATSRARTERSNPRASPTLADVEAEDGASSEPMSVSPIPKEQASLVTVNDYRARKLQHELVTREAETEKAKGQAEELRALLEATRQEVQKLKNENHEKNRQWDQEKASLEGKVDELQRHIQTNDANAYQPLRTNEKQEISCCTVL